MNAHDIIRKIEHAGFHLKADGDDIIVMPPGKMTHAQKAWIRQHKPDILAALRSPGAILDTGPAGNDLPAANYSDRALIHVPDLGLSTGRHISCDMTVPRTSLDKLRAVLRFRLKDNGGGGSLLGEPGRTGAELREMLLTKYGDRLATVDGRAL